MNELKAQRRGERKESRAAVWLWQVLRAVRCGVVLAPSQDCKRQSAIRMCYQPQPRPLKHETKTRVSRLKARFTPASTPANIARRIVIPANVESERAGCNNSLLSLPVR